MSARPNVEVAKPVQFISRVHAADKLDCSVQLIDKYIRCGKLPAVRFGRKVLIRLEDLLRVLEEVRQ